MAMQKQKGTIYGANPSALMRVLFICMMQFFCARAANAVIFWNDGFEYADQAAMEAVWSTSCPGNSSIISPSSLQFYSGAKSLRETFRGEQARPPEPATPGYQSCYMDRSLPSGDEIYTRVYVRLSDFTTSPISTKMMYLAPNSGYPSFWMVMMWGSSIPSIGAQNIQFSDGTIGTENVYGSIALPQNEWACVETHYKMNTPGVADGVMELWINGATSVSRNDMILRTATPIMGNSPTAQFDLIRMYTQDGLGDIFYDDLSIGTERIGCEPIPNCDAVNIVGQVLPSCPLDNDVDMRLNTDEPAAVGNAIQNIINGP